MEEPIGGGELLRSQEGSYGTGSRRIAPVPSPGPLVSSTTPPTARAFSNAEASPMCP